MATASHPEGRRNRTKYRFSAAKQVVLRTVLVGLSCLLVLGCTSIRPVAKIGLLAPFEGLYRRTGYSALAAMRLALADAPPATTDLLPLALDSSRDPARAAQKLLADPTVGAVVGPFSLVALRAVQPLQAGSLPWLIPFAVEPAGGFVADVGAPDQVERWAHPLVAAAAATASRLGCQRLVLAGWPPGWPTEKLAAAIGQTGLTLALENDPAAVRAGDSVLHLAEPHVAASFANRLDDAGLNFPLFLGSQGEDPVFVEQSQNSNGVAWLAWLDDDYASWASAQGLASPTAYQVYRATQAALATMSGRPLTAQAPWRLQWFVYDETGQPHATERPSGRKCQL